MDVSDLLGRELASVDVEAITRFFRDKKVLITGGGGSIGSELARVLCRCKCPEIILVDFSENNLYEVQMDLQLISPQQKMSAYLTDVCDAPELEKIFEKHRPDIVFHAAAHKQVPVVETHFLQGVRNNVLGTKTTVDLALKYKAEYFTLISTDKAIHPKSVMGTSKRVSELYLQSLTSPATRLFTVRFGNVFNSRGSVVPLFRKQIAETRSVTITDPEATRYFMDCTEAVFLILQTVLIGRDSEIFILDMGKPVKIVDLAHNLAQLMGVSPQELSIRYTGLRPGEKLAELIQLEEEVAQETLNPKIKIWKTSNKPASGFQKELNKLIELVSGSSTREEVVAQLKKIVPEYKP
ncbi:MAG: UDP-N-acetyl-alpha-D-glucosamine C6 dehydratase [Candidatus Omnitrophica bacterium ADurb.Bin277]|nr:MAG: UDP-N-acetyl-alpha-D-glucosamine C6 dehydratase [Candidatus Omnitrophica bacterium ADurb.Bin277]